MNSCARFQRRRGFKTGTMSVDYAVSLLRERNTKSHRPPVKRFDTLDAISETSRVDHISPHNAAAFATHVVEYTIERADKQTTRRALRKQKVHHQTVYGLLRLHERSTYHEVYTHFYRRMAKTCFAVDETLASATATPTVTTLVLDRGFTITEVTEENWEYVKAELFFDEDARLRFCFEVVKVKREGSGEAGSLRRFIAGCLRTLCASKGGIEGSRRGSGDAEKVRMRREEATMKQHWRKGYLDFDWPY